MKIILVVVFIYFSATSAGKTTKKFKDESAILNKKLIGKAKPLPPAIIAIEIVDPNENKTSKNSKRTIDSFLGYGYQSPPKYQVYKYSQHDIPPYRGPPNILSHGIKSHQYDFQKSISYNLPSQTHRRPNLNQYYQPGTTLYSTLNNQGQVGGLSSNIPHAHSNEPQVPVIILRVYPNQLNDPSASLHPNLPQNHPLAAIVNSIDVQALLTKYVQNLLLGQTQQHYQQEQQYQYQQSPQEYAQPVQEYQYQYMQQPEYQQNYQTQQDDGLLTHENYPKDTHTQVIFRTDKNKLGISPPVETKTIQIAIPEGAYSSVQVETPEMQYGYTTGDDQQSYYQQQYDVPQNYYYPESGYQQVEAQQQIDYSPSPVPEYETPYNYHAHQKKSRNVRFSRVRQQKKEKDEIRLDPITV